MALRVSGRRFSPGFFFVHRLNPPPNWLTSRMTAVLRFRAKAARCERLAATVLDQHQRQRLLELRQAYLDDAAEIETRRRRRHAAANRVEPGADLLAQGSDKPKRSPRS